MPDLRSLSSLLPDPRHPPHFCTPLRPARTPHPRLLGHWRHPVLHVPAKSHLPPISIWRYPAYVYRAQRRADTATAKARGRAGDYGGSPSGGSRRKSEGRYRLTGSDNDSSRAGQKLQDKDITQERTGKDQPDAPARYPDLYRRLCSLERGQCVLRSAPIWA